MRGQEQTAREILILQSKLHLIEENILIVYAHNPILQCALPPALGACHLRNQIHEKTIVNPIYFREK